MTTRTEFLAELADLITVLLPTIEDDFRAFDEYADDDTPSLLLTIGVDAHSWGWQTGDASYTGDVYGFPYWGQIALRRYHDPMKAAEELLADLEAGIDSEAGRLFYDPPGIDSEEV